MTPSLACSVEVYRHLLGFGTFKALDGEMGTCTVMYVSAVLAAVTCSPCPHRGVMLTAAPDAEVA